MMRQSLDISSLRDIDLSLYSDHLLRYVERIESRLGKCIRFLDLATHPSPKDSFTHVDIGFCVQCFPAVWVNREELERVRDREALLAHEATHIELALVESYPMVGWETEELKPKAERVHRINMMLQDFVVDKRLAAFGFDRSEDFDQRVNTEVRQAREGKDLVWANMRAQRREFQSAVELAGFNLSPWCRSSHQGHLRRVYSKRHRNAPRRAGEIIDIVKSTDKVLEAEGQKLALSQIAAMFDLDSTYIIRTVHNIDCP